MTPGVFDVVNGLSVCSVKRCIVIGIRSYLLCKGRMDQKALSLFAVIILYLKIVQQFRYGNWVLIY